MSAEFMAMFGDNHVTEDDFNFAMGFTNESSLEKRLKEAADNFNRQYAQIRQADGQCDEDTSGRVFHLFPKLPGELQLAVWKHAAYGLPVPKVQAFDFDLAYDANAAPVGRAGNGVIACFKPKYTRALTGHRGLLMACADSRKAFLEFADYTMQPLTYLVSPPAEEEEKEPETFTEYIEKSNKNFDNMYVAYSHHDYNNNPRPPRKAKAKAKTKEVVPQSDKKFVHVILPINFNDTHFLIDKVADTFAYTTVHPTAPTEERVFTQAAGLEIMHKIKKLAFSTNQASFSSERIFSDFFATSPHHWRCSPLPGPSPFTLGVLEELTYVSAKAFRRQCCIGHAHVWATAPSIDLKTFQRGLRTGRELWPVADLYRVHVNLMANWRPYDRSFNHRWLKAMKQPCTCRR